MGKTLTPIGKMSRREGIDLQGGDKSPLTRRPFPPGQHGPAQAKRKPRLSSYGIQLREKQKAKRLYDMRERPFFNFYKEALKHKGNSADFILQYLELRLDNTVYRLGFAKTRRQARQMVSHCFIEVNGKTVNIASYRVRVGEVIKIRDIKKGKTLLKDVEARLSKHEPPKWLSMDASTLTGKVTNLPTKDDVEKVFDPTLIVEFYSR